MKIHVVLSKETSFERAEEIVSFLKLENVNWVRAARFRILTGDTDLTEFPTLENVTAIQFDEEKRAT